MELLLTELGNPQAGRKTIHIAGTKGKGSTAAMIASILRTAGHRTGLFTSPHLYSWQERINVDGRPVAQKDFARLVNLARPHVEEINKNARFGCLTTFEVLTAIAFLYFREKGAAFQVLETGMGGRLDATNVVRPEVCILLPSASTTHKCLVTRWPGLRGRRRGSLSQAARWPARRRQPQPAQLSGRDAALWMQR
jgi:dihydrofolate synthase/folylpolyglutamate synthase